MNFTKKVINLADAYNETLWINYMSCFEQVLIQDQDLDILPNDILNVLVTLFGIEETKVWITKKLNGMDNYSVLELINSDIGIKALKMFVLSLPN